MSASSATGPKRRDYPRGRSQLWPPPGTGQTGHYNRHFNTCLGIGKQLEGGYNLTLPVAALETGEQDSRALPCLPAHELLQAEMDETPELLELLETAKTSGGAGAVSTRPTLLPKGRPRERL